MDFSKEITEANSRAKELLKEIEKLQKWRTAIRITGAIIIVIALTGFIFINPGDAPPTNCNYRRRCNW